ncbi:V-type proton ATPase subunit G 1-like [Monodelphis domestica]|uniref:V-type proton ATPase subunit G 1-like n=1 Tax=Monodelphis domestica TaxID=13616 RepID=UPI0024E1D257|nr:V-type proton ATPase subunit G 1-like [Monodelphis domestica]
MTSQSQGIQQLLQAEKNASEKIAQARVRRQEKLRKAYDEAKVEIEEFRQERNKAFEVKEAEALSHDDMSNKLNEEADEKIERLQELYNLNKDQLLYNMSVEKQRLQGSFLESIC